MDQMAVGAGGEGGVLLHPSLPVTIEDLERISTSEGIKRVHSPASSHDGSTKSEKNMTDFDGEDYNASEEELERIDNEMNRKNRSKVGATSVGPHSPTTPPSPPSKCKL